MANVAWLNRLGSAVAPVANAVATFPGMHCALKGLTFSPWIRAHQRILRGAGDDVWQYYQSLCERRD